MSDYRGDERRDMSTHNIALTALNKIEAHMDECTRRQVNYEKKQDNLMESLEKNRDEIAKLTKLAFAGTAVLFVAMKLTDWFAPVIFHVPRVGG